MILRKIVIRIFQKFFDPIAFKLGYINKKLSGNDNASVDAYNKGNLLQIVYSIFKSVNFNPKHIVDIGANHGTWTRQALIDFPDCKYTLLEPQAEMKESIKDLLENNPNISFHAVGAGKESGTFNFTIVDRDDSCSFAYSAEEAKEKDFKQIEVPVVSLNEFISKQNLPTPDIIKIDAEGLDIDVLEGANNFFGKTEVFMVEAGIVNKRFSNGFLEVINFMNKNEYRLFDITDLNRPFNPPVLWLTELVFVKKNGIIDSYKWV